MSHFVTVVALPTLVDVEGQLERVLEPFNENREVDPYKKYEKDATPDTWWYSEQLRQKYLIPEENATWKQVAEAVNKEWYEGTDYNEYERYLVDDIGMYQMSTYNPDSKWDWYEVGGRWSGYFTYKYGALMCDIVPAASHWSSAETPFGEPEPIAEFKCNGGLRRWLDLEAMESAKVEEAAARYMEYQDMVKGTPPALPFESFAYLGEDQREAYWDQPRRKATRGGSVDSPFFWISVRELEELDTTSLEEYTMKCKDYAFSGYALVDLEGNWHERGSMGWFGMDDSTEQSEAQFKRFASEYIRNLDPDVAVVAVDIHI